jgi:ubiquinone/menaquinone biosynthesis C-methylase UbiE
VLLENNREAEIKGFNRLKFQTFSGMTIPFVDTHFDGAIARYSFHHFPDAEAAVREIGRVIKKGGFYFIVDPTPNKRDNVDFINKFSQLRNDGHMRYYEETELNRVFQSEGMIYESTFYSELTIPREMNEGYQTLLDGTPRNVRESYKLKVKDDKMEVTIRVMNVLFRK